MSNYRLMTVVAVFLLAPCIEPAYADLVTYEYTGPNYTTVTGGFTNSNSLTGTMTIDVPAGGGMRLIGDITAIELTTTYSGTSSFSISGTANAASGGDWFVTFDSGGTITDWAVSLSAEVFNVAGPEVLATESSNTITGSGSFASVNILQFNGQTSPVDFGSWSAVAVAVPEPSAFLYLGLVGIGALGCTSLRTRRRQRLLTNHT